LKERGKFVISLVMTALRVVWKVELQSLAGEVFCLGPDGIPLSKTANFINSLILSLGLVSDQSHYSSYFSLFYKVPRLGEEVQRYFCEKKVALYLLQLSSEWMYQNKCSGVPPLQAFSADIAFEKFGPTPLCPCPSSRRAAELDGGDFQYPQYQSRQYFWQAVQGLLF